MEGSGANGSLQEEEHVESMPGLVVEAFRNLGSSVAELGSDGKRHGKGRNLAAARADTDSVRR